MFVVHLNPVSLMPPTSLFNHFPSVLFVALRLQGVMLPFVIGELVLLIHFSRQI